MTVFSGKIRRRPLGSGTVFPGDDPQAIPPVWWCDRCGSEVFEHSFRLCQHCRKMEKQTERSKYEFL